MKLKKKKKIISILSTIQIIATPTLGASELATSWKARDPSLAARLMTPPPSAESNRKGPQSCSPIQFTKQNKWKKKSWSYLPLTPAGNSKCLSQYR